MGWGRGEECAHYDAALKENAPSVEAVVCVRVCVLFYRIFTSLIQWSRHHWDPSGCPVWRGVPNSEVDLYTALCGWNADWVLIKEVTFHSSHRSSNLHIVLPLT